MAIAVLNRSGSRAVRSPADTLGGIETRFRESVAPR